MKRILLIHPYGNINHNPNLHAIVQLLDEHGFSTDILCPQFPNINQQPPAAHANMIFVDSDNLEHSLMSYCQTVSREAYELVIGVDKGIIPAAAIFRRVQIPYVLLSYELTFGDEVGLPQKKEEIEACADISFAVCQDSVRSFLLSREQAIPPNKIFQIPVAGRYSGPYKKSDYLRQKFSIPRDKKIALYAGSLSSWGMIGDLIESVSTWPKDWVLVLHPRYGEEPRIAPYLKKAQKSASIYISDVPMETPQAMQEIVCSCDVGIALYTYRPNNPLLGKNILCIGLASSKLAMYLQYGIPVITNEIGQMSESIRQNQLGLAVRTIRELDLSQLDRCSAKILSENCTTFFKETLDFKRYEKRLLSLLQRAIANKECAINEQLLPPWNVPESMIQQLIVVFKDYYDLYQKREQQKYSPAAVTRRLREWLAQKRMAV